MVVALKKLLKKKFLYSNRRNKPGWEQLKVNMVEVEYREKKKAE